MQLSVTSVDDFGPALTLQMGAEVGATTSVFPYSESMRSYLVATGRAHVARACDKAQHAGFLAADPSCEYDQHIRIDLSKLEPHLKCVGKRPPL